MYNARTKKSSHCGYVTEKSFGICTLELLYFAFEQPEPYYFYRMVNSDQCLQKYYNKFDKNIIMFELLNNPPEIDLLLVINCIYTLLLISSYKYEWLHNTLTNRHRCYQYTSSLLYPCKVEYFQILRALTLFGMITFMVIS